LAELTFLVMQTHVVVVCFLCILATAVHLNDEGDGGSFDWDGQAPGSEIHRKSAEATDQMNEQRVGNIKAEMEKIAPGSTKGLNDMLVKMNAKMEKLAPGLNMKPGAAAEVAAAPAPSAAVDDVVSTKAASPLSRENDNIDSLRTQVASSTRGLTNTIDVGSAGADETMAVAGAANKMIEMEAAQEQKEEKEMTDEVKKQEDIIAIASAAKKISQAKLKSLEASTSALKQGQHEAAAATAAETHARPKQSLVQEEVVEQPRRHSMQEEAPSSSKLDELLEQVSAMLKGK